MLSVLIFFVMDILDSIDPIQRNANDNQVAEDIAENPSAKTSEAASELNQLAVL